MKKIKIFAMMIWFVFLSGGIYANQMLNLIDVPTANVLDSYGYNLSFRFYSGGGILSAADFGVLQRVNIGFSWDLDRVVGTEDIDVQKPAVSVKLRLFDGQMYVPALALGYNGQGYNFDKASDEYLHREKGVYMVVSSEMFFPGFEYNAGGYIYDFHEDKVMGFIGSSLLMGDSIALIAEYDNIHNADENRFNASLRYFVAPTIFVDLAGRDMGAAGRDAERIVRISYLGSF